MLLLRAYPKNIWERIFGYLNLNNARMAIYYQGYLYSFSKGKFYCRKRVFKSLQKKYEVVEEKNDDEQVLKILQGLTNSQWTIANNCLLIREVWNARFF